MRSLFIALLLVMLNPMEASQISPEQTSTNTAELIKNNLPQRIEGDSIREALSNYIFINSQPIPVEIVISIINIESSGNIKAKGREGEIGLMQIHPKYWTNVFPICGKDLYDPLTNVCYGINILKTHYAKTADLEDSILMYNGSLSSKSYLNKVLCGVGRISWKFRETQQQDT